MISGDLFSLNDYSNSNINPSQFILNNADIILLFRLQRLKNLATIATIVENAV